MHRENRTSERSYGSADHPYRDVAAWLATTAVASRFRWISHRQAEHSVAANGFSWDAFVLPDAAKLWLYNLHYFDDLRAEGATDRLPWQRDLIARWIVENPPAAGNGWEPYPASLRIVNWIAWALAGNDLGAAALQSLAVQVR